MHEIIIAAGVTKKDREILIGGFEEQIPKDKLICRIFMQVRPSQLIPQLKQDYNRLKRVYKPHIKGGTYAQRLGKIPISLLHKHKDIYAKKLKERTKTIDKIKPKQISTPIPPAQNKNNTKKKLYETLDEYYGKEKTKLMTPFVEYLWKNNHASEFKIAEKTKLSVQDVRRLYYLLENEGFATHIRKKDKAKGWYIAYLTLKKDMISHKYTQKIKEKIEGTENWLKRETEDQFYSCKDRCMRSNMDSALNLNFTCPECGDLMSPETEKEKQHKIENIKKELKTLNEKIGVKKVDKDSDEACRQIQNRAEPRLKGHITR